MDFVQPSTTIKKSPPTPMRRAATFHQSEQEQEQTMM